MGMPGRSILACSDLWPCHCAKLTVQLSPAAKDLTCSSKRLCKAIYFLTRAQGRRTCADGRHSARVVIAWYLFGPKPKGPPCGFGGASSQTDGLSSGTKLDTLSNMPFSVLRCGDVSGYGLRSSGHVRFFSRTGHVVQQHWQDLAGKLPRVLAALPAPSICCNGRRWHRRNPEEAWQDGAAAVQVLDCAAHAHEFRH